jgi:hypothetical protein
VAVGASRHLAARLTPDDPVTVASDELHADVMRRYFATLWGLEPICLTTDF